MSLTGYRSEKGERSLQLFVHPELAAHLTAGYRSQLLRLSWKYWTRIRVVVDENISMDEFRFFDKEGKEDLTPRYS